MPDTPSNDFSLIYVKLVQPSNKYPKFVILEVYGYSYTSNNAVDSVL